MKKWEEHHTSGTKPEVRQNYNARAQHNYYYENADAAVTYVGWMKGVEVVEVGRGNSVAEPGVLLSLSSEGVRSSVPG